MLYNIQVRLNRIDHSIGTLSDIVTFNWVSNNMLLDANVIVNRLITGLVVLRNNVERIYRYLNVIASQEVNPVMIPPPPLRQLLAEIQEEMKSNPRLMLPYDPQTEIYKFYEVCCNIGQIDIFSRIELFPLSSCQVIILIARMTFNCSTSCLMS